MSNIGRFCKNREVGSGERSFQLTQDAVRFAHGECDDLIRARLRIADRIDA